LTASCAAVGGKLDSIHYALGDDDVFVVVDVPSHVQVAAIVAAASGSGLIRTSTVPLLTVAVPTAPV